MSDKTGGSAFPCAADVNPDGIQSGMTLRDYFAAKAMHALLVADGTTRFDQRAREAYEMADAMLKERGDVCQ